MNSFTQRIVLPYFIFVCFAIFISFGLGIFESLEIFMESSLFFAIAYSFLGLIYLQIVKLSIFANPSKAIGMTMFAMMIKFFMRTAVIFMFITLKKDFESKQILTAIFWLVYFMILEVWLTGRIGKMDFKK